MDLIDIPTPDRIVITQVVQYYVCASTNNVHDIDIDISYSYLTSCIVQRHCECKWFNGGAHRHLNSSSEITAQVGPPKKSVVRPK